MSEYLIPIFIAIIIRRRKRKHQLSIRDTSGTYRTYDRNRNVQSVGRTGVPFGAYLTADGSFRFPQGMHTARADTSHIGQRSACRVRVDTFGSIAGQFCGTSCKRNDRLHGNDILHHCRILRHNKGKKYPSYDSVIAHSRPYGVRIKCVNGKVIFAIMHTFWACKKVYFCNISQKFIIILTFKSIFGIIIKRCDLGATQNCRAISSVGRAFDF